MTSRFRSEIGFLANRLINFPATGAKTTVANDAAPCSRIFLEMAPVMPEDAA